MNRWNQSLRTPGAGSFARAWIAAPLFAAVLLGCGDGDRKSPSQPNPSPTATPTVGAANLSRPDGTTTTLSASLRESVRDAGQELRDLGNQVEARIESTDFQAKKEAFLRSSRDELDQLKASIDKLGEKSAVASENAKQNFQEWIADLKAKSADADAELDKARASGSDAWDDTQARTKSATQRLKEAYNATLEKMKINQ